MQLKQVIAIALLSTIGSTVNAQVASTHTAQAALQRKPSQRTASPSLQTQIQEMREDLQNQIDELRSKLAARDAQIESLQANAQVAQDKVVRTATQVQTIDSNVHQNAAAMNTLEASVTSLQVHDTTIAASIQQAQASQEKLQKGLDEPATIRYKGISIIPGGFMAGESIWRQRAMNADIYTNYNSTPYMNTGEAHTSEWVPTARQSRISTLFTGNVPFGTISGYFEGDFLSAGVTSNNLQSNSYTLRVRQAWAQTAFSHYKFTAGQMWTLLTEDKTAEDPGQEAVPLFFDANLHVGDTYIRQPGFRLEDSLSPKITVAVALENSQYQFSASNAPSNFFFGNAGAAGGLNNSTANYTNQVAPDVLVKASYEPGYGHYEIGGVARFFRDRYYPNATAVGAANNTELGGGFVANARFPVAPKLDLGLHLVAGDGTGRYGVSILPDVTVRPNGTLVPLRNLQGLFSLEAHPDKRLDLFAYAGTEYVQRTYYRSSTGTLIGYAPPSASNVGCNVEAVPTAGTGYAPGSSTCLGATRVIVQGSVGWVYRIYSGPAGRVQYGLAYSYLTREAWAGIGGAPKATNNFVYTSFRYYIP
jgi:hypothetical protein